MSFHVPEQFRVTHPVLGDGEGNNGFFMVRLKGKTDRIRCIASDGMGWEHVSVSWADRCPTWAEMCAIKDLFWDEDDWVVQFHPAASEYVNNHPYCLHLWRPTDAVLPKPEMIMVGFKKTLQPPTSEGRGER